MAEQIAKPQPEPAKGLPPVVPPSGRFIAQMFFIPLLIVVGIVAVVLGLKGLAGSSQTPEAFLRDLDSTNPEVRWRAASDLAQVLKRDEALAADPQFGLRLAGLLRSALDENKSLSVVESAEKDAKKSDSKPNQARMRRSYIQYLAACLGNLSTPVGAPVLCDMARSNYGGDEKTRALLRRQAVWALANLGDNVRKFENLGPDQRQAVLDALNAETVQAGAGPAGDWAKKSQEFLSGTGRLGVIDALAECATSDDPFLRKQVALALSFWDGDESETRLAEETLLRLTRDDGRGTAIEIGEKD